MSSMMIDPNNLQTASLYINNQLLSRGLLRDGQHIDFAALGYGNGEGLETSQKIINLINDMILRRDRDAEQRESLSNALRDLGAENLKSTGDMNRLTEKAAEAQRKFDIASTSEASMRTQLKSAESAMRGLRDELARTKALVSQARASCATEIKRRDRQIDTLKKQVAEAGRTRGAKANSAITTITVTGHIVGGGDEKSQSSRDEARGGHDSPLRTETNGFLAKMVQGLGEENESLLRTIKETTDRLRELSGWASDKNEDVQIIRQPGWEELSLELNAVMDHMRSILTNPSFVPIEEVIVREEEINQLKAGWLKMESRWEDAVHLMDAWRKRMAVNGKPVDEEDLKIGMGLSPVRIKDIEETRYARKPGYLKYEVRDGSDKRAAQPPLRPGSRQSGPEEECDEGEGPGDSESEFNGFDDEILTDEYGVQIIQEPDAATTYLREPSQESSPLPEPPQLSPLKNSSSAGNRRPQTIEVLDNPKMTIRGQEAARTSRGTLGTGKSLPHRAAFATGEAHHSRSGSSSTSRARQSQSIRPEGPLFPVEDEAAPRPQREEKPTRMENGRHSSLSQNPRRGFRTQSAQAQHSDPPSQSKPLTTSHAAAKLAADEAKIRPKVRPARAVSVSTQRSAVSPTEDPPSQRADREPEVVVRRREDVDPVKRDPARAASDEQKPERRKRDRRPARTTSRRRSSLIPAEVERLIASNVP